MDRKVMRQLDAFLSVDFNWTRGLKSVWSDVEGHVPALNHEASDKIFDYFLRSTRNPAPDNEPLGQIIVGPAGSGKTHLIGDLRRRVWEADGFFILVDLVGVKDFWASTALSFFNSLQVTRPDGKTQHWHLLYKLAQHVSIEAKMLEIIAAHKTDPYGLVGELATLFVDSLTSAHRQGAMAHRDVVTALILLLSNNASILDVAFYWLQGLNIEDAEIVKLYGFRRDNEPIKVVEGLSWLMSLVGPTMIAVDQIDAIVTASQSQAELARVRGARNEALDLETVEAQSIVDLLALGLMELHDRKTRAVTVVSCLVETWESVQNKALKSSLGRYREPITLKDIKHSGIAREIVAARMAKSYARDKFVPPTPIWPFSEGAFETAINMKPRALLQACEKHRLHCEALGKIEFCDDFGRAPPAPPQQHSDDLDRRFEEFRAAAEIGGLVSENGEEAMDALFEVVLPLYAAHLDLPDDVDVEAAREPQMRIPPLHGRLKFIFRSESDREQHYCFRALPSKNHIAFQARLRAAMTASGVDRALKFRHLFLLRGDAPPKGARSAELVAQFEKAGGRFVAPEEADLRIFVALQKLAAQKPQRFEAWLRERKPLFDTALFKNAGLSPPAFLASNASIALETKSAARPTSGPQSRESMSRQSDEARISIGRRGGDSGEELWLDLAALKRHMAVLAGSGSGKTVFLRRVIEEAALLGCPAVVLDVNNDLARLGDPWDPPPADFAPADAEKADDYFRKTETMIWTPGVAAGNPLRLRLLPDFAAIADGDDLAAQEKAEAVAMALETLAQHLGGGGRQAQRKKGVLADALRAFANRGGGDLSALLQLLDDLPDHVTEIRNGAGLAAEIADDLRTAVAIDPLLQEDGEVHDVGALFNGRDGRARISVINLAGLASDEAKQAFVNRLQMALFTWIRQNPSVTPRLYVLDEAQNFAPATRSTACKASTLSLVAQSRKYGLGMIFATQLPRGVDNGVVSNCTTHVYGRMSAPATIQATQAMMEAKGGAADDLGRLGRGEFYFATEGYQRPVKMRTPLCLSHHPANPPTPQEVIDKARRCR
jgi:hypothetical protein